MKSLLHDDGGFGSRLNIPEVVGFRLVNGARGALRRVSIAGRRRWKGRGNARSHVGRDLLRDLTQTWRGKPAKKETEENRKIIEVSAYDAFLTSVPISVTADVIFEGWSGSNFI